MRDVQPEKIFDLAGENNYGNAACEADNYWVGNKFDEGPELGKPHDHENYPGHDSCEHQSVDAVLLDNAVQNYNECTGGAAYLDPASSKK